MITRAKKALGITNQELIKKGIHKSQISRWKKSGFPQSYEILLIILINEVNMLKKQEFIRNFVKFGRKIENESDIRTQISGIIKFMLVKNETIPEWMDLDLASEIIKNRG